MVSNKKKNMITDVSESSQWLANYIRNASNSIDIIQ